MRQLATIRTIASTRPIQGADRIEVAQVDGWECVVKKGEFEVGQHIVYVEVDSVSSEFAPSSCADRSARGWFCRWTSCLPVTISSATT